MIHPEDVVYVVDDDNNMRTAIRALLKSVGIATEPFASAHEFLDYLKPELLGCLVLDVRMPKMDGLQLLGEVRRRGSSLPVILITGHADVQMAVAAMRHGAFDFLEKPFRDQELIDRVQQALLRDRSERAERARVEELRARYRALTPREKQVVGMLSAGLGSKEMAGELGLSRRTIEIHRCNVMRKMSAGSVAALVHMLVDLRDEVASDPRAPTASALPASLHHQ